MPARCVPGDQDHARVPLDDPKGYLEQHLDKLVILARLSQLILDLGEFERVGRGGLLSDQGVA